MKTLQMLGATAAIAAALIIGAVAPSSAAPDDLFITAQPGTYGTLDRR